MKRIFVVTGVCFDKTQPLTSTSSEPPVVRYTVSFLYWKIDTYFLALQKKIVKHVLPVDKLKR